MSRCIIANSTQPNAYGTQLGPRSRFAVHIIQQLVSQDEHILKRNGEQQDERRAM